METRLVRPGNVINLHNSVHCKAEFKFTSTNQTSLQFYYTGKFLFVGVAILHCVECCYVIIHKYIALFILSTISAKTSSPYRYSGLYVMAKVIFGDCIIILLVVTLQRQPINFGKFRLRVVLLTYLLVLFIITKVR